MKKTLLHRGFTLIELMIVVGIIAILSAIVITNLAKPQAKARDAKRISDLGQIQLTLALFYDRCKEYPVNIDSTDASVTPGDGSKCDGVAKLGDYLSQIPRPPGTTVDDLYTYFTNTGNTDFVLHAKLEQSEGEQANSLRSGSQPGWSNGSVSCYDGTSVNMDYCLGSK